jgi:hypothetical protein
LLRATHKNESKDVPELEPKEPDDSDDEIKDVVEEELSAPVSRHSTRIAEGAKKPEKYALATKVDKNKE